MMGKIHIIIMMILGDYDLLFLPVKAFLSLKEIVVLFLFLVCAGRESFLEILTSHLLVPSIQIFLLLFTFL